MSARSESYQPMSFTALIPSSSVRAMLMMLVAMFRFTGMGIFTAGSATCTCDGNCVFPQFSRGIDHWPLSLSHRNLADQNEPSRAVSRRAAINFIGMFCGFTSVTLIPLAENTALSFTSPIFVTIGAVIFLVKSFG